MRKLFIGFCLSLTLLLGGCGSGNPFVMQDKATLQTPVEKAQGAINNVKSILTVMVNTAVADRKLYSNAEWLELKENLLDARKHTDDAEIALRLGDELLSKDKLQLANTVITFIKAELVKEQQKENN